MTQLADSDMGTLLRDVARSRPTVPLTGPTEGQLVAIKQLADLVKEINTLVTSVVTTGAGDWLLIAYRAERVAERCRNEDRMAIELQKLNERTGGI